MELTLQRAMLLLAEVEREMSGGKFHSDLCEEIHAACDAWFGDVRPHISQRPGTRHEP